MAIGDMHANKANPFLRRYLQTANIILWPNKTHTIQYKTRHLLLLFLGPHTNLSEREKEEKSAADFASSSSSSSSSSITTQSWVAL